MNVPSNRLAVLSECWTEIGVWGNRTCPTLLDVVHCHNCAVFGGASRRFLEGPCPPGYLDEWTSRLTSPLEVADQDIESVMIFRLGDEWLALRVAVLIEVTTMRPIHRIPHRTGFLAGIANIRGELQLCARLDLALGLRRDSDVTASSVSENEGNKSRLIVVQADGERWVFPVDEVDEVFRFPISELGNVPATLSRSHQRFTKGVFQSKGRAVGLLDDGHLFPLLRGKIR